MKKQQQLLTLAAAAISTAPLSSCGFAEQKDIRLSGQHTISAMGEEMSAEDVPVDCDAEGIYLPETENDPYVDTNPNQDAVDYHRMLDKAEKYDLPVEAGSALTYEMYQENRDEFHTVLIQKVMEQQTEEQDNTAGAAMAQGMLRSILPGLLDNIAVQLNDIVAETCSKPKQG